MKTAQHSESGQSRRMNTTRLPSLRSSCWEGASYLVLGLAAAASLALFYHPIARFAPQAHGVYARLSGSSPAVAQLASAAAPQPTNVAMHSGAGQGGSALTNRSQPPQAPPAPAAELPTVPTSKAESRRAGGAPLAGGHQKGGRCCVAPLWVVVLGR